MICCPEPDFRPFPCCLKNDAFRSSTFATIRPSTFATIRPSNIPPYVYELITIKESTQKLLKNSETNSNQETINIIIYSILPISLTCIAVGCYYVVLFIISRFYNKS